MSVTDFDQRRNRILELIIEAYVSTASPVGSEMVAKRLRSSLSSATIRNIMVELEGAGYVEQPHTSAGRVPTDRGYRFYVDSVMDVRHLPPEELRQLAALIQPSELDVESLFERAMAALAELTQQAAFAVAPTLKQSTVKQIELVPLSVRKVLCVLVANDEMIASHVVEIVEPMSRDETFYHFVKRSLDILQHALSTEPNERLLVDGATYVVAQPEFSRNPRKAHAFLKGLDAEEPLLGRVREDLSRSRVQVRIGHELAMPAFEECSYITAPVGMGGEVIGGIGILGPTRMDYPRMRALVEGMGQAVSRLLSQWDER